jgi:hypothetical protein
VQYKSPPALFPHLSDNGSIVTELVRLHGIQNVVRILRGTKHNHLPLIGEEERIKTEYLTHAPYLFLNRNVSL